MTDADYIEQLEIKVESLEDENKALRELIQELWHLVNHRSGYGYAAALEHIEELGIEVDE